MFEETFKQLPVMVNDCYGDPFLSYQVRDTFSKLRALKRHKGPVGLITKMVFGEDILNLIEPSLNNNLVIFYSFTGLDEGGFSFEERHETFSRLCDAHKNVVLLIRPIIPNRNDNTRMLTKLCDVGKEFNRPVVYEGGYKRPGTRVKYLDSKVRLFLENYCQKRDIVTYSKTSCAAGGLLNSRCVFHIDEEPMNLNALKFLGYVFETSTKGKISIEKGTIGDKNFIRFLTHSQPIIANIDWNTNILSISTQSLIFECTSSWYVWSRNLSKCLGCDYCMIPGIEHLKYPLSIGINPVLLSTLGKK